MNRFLSLAAVVAFALPALAQTESQGQVKPVGETEKIWHLQTSGLGG